ncbi:MAG: response regulator transcription factor [Thermoleophilia bacterium]|nr:response regulator transcription factor [Thermoleophilia bacterium]
MADATHTESVVRLLLVEDETKLAMIIAKALTGQGYAVDVATRGDEAYALLSRPSAPWELVILDRMLPGLDGASICRQLRSSGIETPIIMLTAMSGVDDRIDGLDAGADDYLPKPFALKELYARVRSVLRVRRAAGPMVVAEALESIEQLVVGDLALDVDGLVAFRGDQRIDLRPKEAAILACLMRQPDRVVGRWSIFDAAWGDVDVPSANHLDVHIRRIRQKVDRPFDRRSIETVRGAGYRIRGDGR